MNFLSYIQLDQIHLLLFEAQEKVSFIPRKDVLYRSPISLLTQLQVFQQFLYCFVLKN